MRLRAVLAALALGSCHSGPGVCTLVGCSSQTTVRIGPIHELSPYTAASVTLCSNKRCTDVALGHEVVGEFRVSAILDEARVIVAIDSRGRETFHDGDEYTLTIRDRYGDAILQHAWTAEYREWFPNGTQCGPRCLTQTIELPAPTTATARPPTR